MSHNILVISEGPPPLGSTAAEGGALRAWGLSKGLVSHGFDVTFAYRSTFKLADDAAKTHIPSGLTVTTWNPPTLRQILEQHSVVVMRYAMGEAKEIIAKLKPDHILVSDSYIPISIEVAARNSNDKYENDNFLRLQEGSALATRRADYFLYASPAQKNYYLGYLAGLNKLNPATYSQLEERMFEVPYGIDTSEKKKELLKRKPDSPTLLWYGAFYSWFDMESLIGSLIQLKKKVPGFKLIIAGAKNPYNKDPGILAHYKKTTEALEVLGDTIEYINWHPFDERFEVYAKATAIITWNHLGLENLLAWRTRLMDFVLSDRPIITNGGDPLGEDLITRGIAYRATVEDVDKVFMEIVKHPPVNALFDKAAERYDWHNITKELADSLSSPSNMINAQMKIKNPVIKVLLRRVKKVALLPLNFYRYTRDNGIRKTARRFMGKRA